jgi:hypothetical protein
VRTLSVELGFYIMLPPVATACFGHPLVGLRVTAAIVVAWHEVTLNAVSAAALFGAKASQAAETRARPERPLS